MAAHMTKMFKIALPDGSVKEMPEGSTPADVAAAIGPGLAKAAIAAKVDGEVRDIMRPFEGDASLALITSRDEAEALELVRHDFAHILAEAVQKLFPGTQITFGPATDDGFYYDFAPAAERGPFTEEDLPAIEEEMRRMIAARRTADPRSVDTGGCSRLLRAHRRGIQGGVGDGAARGRADHHVSLGESRGCVDGPVPRSAPRLDRQARSAMRSS